MEEGKETEELGRTEEIQQDKKEAEGREEVDMIGFMTGWLPLQKFTSKYG